MPPISTARNQHEPVARQAGLSTRQLQAIYKFDSESFGTDPKLAIDKSSGGDEYSLSRLQAAALIYTDAMTVLKEEGVNVPQKTFDALRAELQVGEELRDQQMMEATATAAAYNMVSRILKALNVGGLADDLDYLPPVLSDSHQA